MIRSAFLLFLIMAVLLTGCSGPLQPPAPIETPDSSPVIGSQSLSTVTPGPSSEKTDQTDNDFVGRVVDMNGDPIAEARIESQDSNAVSGREGWFQLSGQGVPQWIKVSRAGFISRTRAAAPGVPVWFRLTPDDGKTIVIHFGGDTMFGRRFFDPNEDNYTADGLLPLNPTVDDHLRLLAPVRPLLESADFTVVNFESILTDQPYLTNRQPRPATFHPTTSSVYASHPNSVIALKQSGVDLVDIGNNHIYDMLDIGLINSIFTLDQAGMLHFGAGRNEANAWAPAILSSKGQTIAFIGCTTLRIPLNTPVRNDVPYIASDVLKKGGAAYCAEAALRSAVVAAKQQADAVIVMIHGGKEYDPSPTSKITYLSEVARQAGAALVINHQPHVGGGFAWRDSSLIAWTIGTFLADQTIWSSLASYMLAVYLREGKVIRAYAEPLIIDGFVPHGLTGELADYVVRGAAGREAGPFIMESGAMEVDLESRALQSTYTQPMDGGSNPGLIIPVPQSQWISGFTGNGKLRLGRDLLWVGGFENEEVESASRVAPLWDLSLGDIRIGRDFAYESETGIRLTRGSTNIEDAVTTNLHRITVQPDDDLSITGMIRIDSGVLASIQLSWYAATSGPSFSKTTQPIKVESYGDWQPFRLDVQVPPGAVALGVYLRLSPPDKGTSTADFDNVRIIEWASSLAQFSPLYNYALLTGKGELTFAQEMLPGAEEWLKVSANSTAP